MSIPITCAGCKSTFDVPDTLAGKTIRCTSCKAQMPVPETLDAVEAVEEAPAAPAKKPFGFGTGPAKSDEAPAPKKAPAPPKPTPAPAPAAKAAPKPAPAKKAEPEEAEEDDDKSKGKSGKPAAKKPGIVGSAAAKKKRRDDDDDDDDDDDKPKKKGKGGSGPMIAIIAAGVLGLAAIAGLGFYLLSGDKKPAEVAKTDSTNNNTPTPANNNPPPAAPNLFSDFGTFDRIGKSGAWAVHKGNGFTAEFPGVPDERGETLPTKPGAPPMAIQVTGVGAKTDALVMAAFVPLPPEAVKLGDSKKLLDLFATGMTQEGPFKGAPGTDMTLDGNPAKSFELKDPSGEAKLQVSVVKDRLYMFIAGGPYKAGKLQLAQADMDRFFASIKITHGSESPGGAKPSGLNPFGNVSAFPKLSGLDRVGTPGAWSAFNGDGFTADFLGTPQTIEDGDAVLGLAGKLTGVGIKGETLLACFSVQLPAVTFEAIGNDPARILKNWLEGMMADGPLAKKVPRDIVFGGYAGKEIDLSDTSSAGILRVALVKNRVYVFFAQSGLSGGMSKLSSTDSDRFFDSIKITYKGPAVAIGPGPQPGPGPMPGPGPQPGDPSATTDGNLKAKIEPFYAAAFDTEKNEVYTIDARPIMGTIKGSLRRYSYPDFKLQSRYKLPHLGARCVIDSKGGFLYVATVTNPTVARLNLLDRSTASGDIAIYDLKPIRDGKTADGKPLGDGAELVPVATVGYKQTINALELSADGKFLYVLTSGGTPTRRSHVALIDTATRKETSRKPLPEVAWDMAKAADGKNLLIIEAPAKNKTASVLTFDTTSLTAIAPTPFPDVVLDVAPHASGAAVVSVKGQQGNGGFGGAGNQQNTFKLYLLDAKGGTEINLGAAPRLSNNGYVKLDADGKRLFVSSYQAAGFDVYEMPQVPGANGLKLVAAIKTAGVREAVGGHFGLAPDGKALLFHNGVVLDANNITGAAPPVVPGVGMVPGFPGGVVPPPPPVIPPMPGLPGANVGAALGTKV